MIFPRRRGERRQRTAEAELGRYSFRINNLASTVGMACFGSVLVLVSVGLFACQANTAPVVADDPDLAAFLEVIIPCEIEIQHNLTRPIRFGNSEQPNGIELIVETRDAFGHEVKCVGTFLVELFERRAASGDVHGKRLAYWSIAVRADSTLAEYWDNLSRWYRLPLRMDQTPLRPGRFILRVQFETLTSVKLVDEYAFDHQP